MIARQPKTVREIRAHCEDLARCVKALELLCAEGAGLTETAVGHARAQAALLWAVGLDDGRYEELVEKCRRIAGKYEELITINGGKQC